MAPETREKGCSRTRGMMSQAMTRAMTKGGGGHREIGPRRVVGVHAVCDETPGQNNVDDKGDHSSPIWPRAWRRICA